MKKNGLIILLSIIVVILLLKINDLSKSQIRQDEQKEYMSQRILQQDERNNLLSNDIETLYSQLVQLEEEQVSLLDQIEVLRNEIAYDDSIFNSIMNYVLEDSDIPRIEMFSRVLYVDSTQLELSRTDQYKILKKDSLIKLSPSPLSMAVKKVEYDYLVKVLEKRRIKYDEYQSDLYYVELMYMDTPTNIRGWIPVESLEAYTADTFRSVVNVRTKRNATVYITSAYSEIKEIPGIVLLSSVNGRIITREDEFVLILGTNDSYFWILDEELYYMEPQS